eukprot:TRINITY_DN11307_c0_g1_i1.p1 TRINITY_DN11307_c0_g1~~TRINITY_DN11307_c0_g1_i1.p1  ORF type:complete len:342 (+),score=42.62 TRINITY_DN11307_c0_g1_i1:96-1028(+)
MASYLRAFSQWTGVHPNRGGAHERQAALVQKLVVISGLLLMFILIIFILSHEPTIPEATGVVQQLESLARTGRFNATLIEEMEQSAVASIQGHRMQLHLHFMEQIRTRKDADVILMGDSITEGWVSAPDVFSQMVADVGAGGSRATVWNFGVSGDRVAQVVWRLMHGELPESFFVKVMVITIGVNDLLSGQSPEATARQISTVVHWLTTLRPQMFVVLCGILPATYKNPDPPRGPQAEVNVELARLDGLNQGRVTFVNCTSLFVSRDGNVDESMYEEDRYFALHLNRKGYEAWSQCLLPAMKDALHRARA